MNTSAHDVVWGKFYAELHNSAQRLRELIQKGSTESAAKREAVEASTPTRTTSQRTWKDNRK